MPEPSGLSPKGITKRVSKNSIKQRNRRGSVASSKKEGSAEQGKAEEEEEPARTKPRRNGFLSFLNCCAPPENANPVDPNDQAVPAKKAKVLQPKPGRQATPMVKPNSSAPESSAADSSKETTGEGIGGPEYSDIKAAQMPKMITHPSKEQIASEKPILPESKDPDPPLPPLPPTDNPRNSALIRPNAEPPQIVEASETAAVQGDTINDRTAQQEQQDSDVVMTDPPPVPDDSTKPDSSQVQMALPPPPPRNGRTEPIATEQQKFLLPPLQSHFKGRKCLVLDLDETLVHSSFKACIPYL